MSDLTLGALVHDFFLDYLTQQKGEPGHRI